MPVLKYATNSGLVARTSVGNAGVALAGTEPAGSPLEGFYVYKSGGTRKTGLRARAIIIRRPNGAPAANGAQLFFFARITVLTLAAFNAIALNSTVTYKGNATWVVSDKKGEG